MRLHTHHSLPALPALAAVVAGVLVAPIVLVARPADRAGTPQGAQAPAQDARVWLGRAAEIEAYLRTAEVVKLEDLSVGVTKPKKATLAPGGPVQFFAWKAIRPGMYNGYRESYQFEVAAYELDKLLGLDMVPPTVARAHRNERGAAIMWVSPTKSFGDLGGAPSPPASMTDMWARQIVKAKMFDNLINNLDPNLGNWLVDPAWNLILIDHTRSFRSGRRMVHEMTRVDENLWNRMKALTEPGLLEALGEWLSDGDIRSVIQRRDRMQELIDELVAERGEAYVFMRGGA